MSLQGLASARMGLSLLEEKAGVLYLNPGSAGRRRFKLPVAVGRIRVHPEGLHGEILELEV